MPARTPAASGNPAPCSSRSAPSASRRTTNRQERLFPSERGTPLRNRNWRRGVFDSAVESLGLKITPHNLRDTAASLAIQEGASNVAVAHLLGEEAATTLNHYAGLFPTDLDDIASRLNAAARVTIAGQGASSDATQPPTTHRPERAKDS
jgi:integrase